MVTAPNILIVEDDRDLVNSLRLFLEKENYRVDSAADGAAGFRKIEEHAPDLIILDVMMATDTDGFDLAHRLKKSPKYSGIPILMLTGFLQAMMEQGPESFHHVLQEDWPVTELLEKPLDPQKLLTAVKSLLGR